LGWSQTIVHHQKIEEKAETSKKIAKIQLPIVQVYWLKLETSRLKGALGV
jgi:hypothetical protein